MYVNTKTIKNWKRSKKGYMNSPLGSYSPKLARRLTKTASRTHFVQSHLTVQIN